MKNTSKYNEKITLVALAIILLLVVVDTFVNPSSNSWAIRSLAISNALLLGMILRR